MEELRPRRARLGRPALKRKNVNIEEAARNVLRQLTVTDSAVTAQNLGKKIHVCALSESFGSREHHRHGARNFTYQQIIGRRESGPRRKRFAA